MKPLNCFAFLFGFLLVVVPAISYAGSTTTPSSIPASTLELCEDQVYPGSPLYYSTPPAPYTMLYNNTTGFPVQITICTQDAQSTSYWTCDATTYSSACLSDPPICEIQPMIDAQGGCYDSSCGHGSLDYEQYCSSNDYIQNYNEAGVDCGPGTLPFKACVTHCPGASTVQTDQAGVTFCGYSAFPDTLGNCPAGYINAPFVNGSAGCLATPPGAPFPAPFLAAEGIAYTDPAPGSVAPPVFQGGTLSFTKMASPETVVQNADGTETATVTTVTTASNGSTETTITSVTRPSGSSSGTGFDSGQVGSGYSGSTQTDGTGSVEDDYSNYSTMPSTGDVFTFNDDHKIPVQDVPEKSFTAIFDNFLNTSELKSSLESFSIITSNPICSVSAGVFYGKEINFSLCQQEGFLIGVGNIFLMLFAASSILIVIRGSK